MHGEHCLDGCLPEAVIKAGSVLRFSPNLTYAAIEDEAEHLVVTLREMDLSPSIKYIDRLIHCCLVKWLSCYHGHLLILSDQSLSQHMLNSPITHSTSWCSRAGPASALSSVRAVHDRRSSQHSNCQAFTLWLEFSGMHWAVFGQEDSTKVFACIATGSSATIGRFQSEIAATTGGRSSLRTRKAEVYLS